MLLGDLNDVMEAYVLLCGFAGMAIEDVISAKLVYEKYKEKHRHLTM